MPRCLCTAASLRVVKTTAMIFGCLTWQPLHGLRFISWESSLNNSPWGIDGDFRWSQTAQQCSCLGVIGCGMGLHQTTPKATIGAATTSCRREDFWMTCGCTSAPSWTIQQILGNGIVFSPNRLAPLLWETHGRLERLSLARTIGPEPVQAMLAP